MSIESFDWFYAVDNRKEDWQPGRSADESGSAGAEIQKPKVLVVDDEQRVADTLREVLVLSGFDAHAVYDGWSALDALERYQPDYLLSDVLMPKMNGVELAMAVSGKKPGIKILLFSGQVGISEILEAGQKRGYSFPLLGKPIHPLKLVERLKGL